MFHHVSRYQKGPCENHVYFLLIYPSANWMFDPLQLQPLKMDRFIIIDYQDRLTIAARKATTIQNMRWTWWKYVYGCFQKVVVPQNGWFIKEIPINPWMIWGEKTLFSETPI